MNDYLKSAPVGTGYGCVREPYFWWLVKYYPRYMYHWTWEQVNEARVATGLEPYGAEKPYSITYKPKHAKEE